MDDVIEEVRVLVIDHDQNSLDDLTNKLREFNYEVTTCSLAKCALSLLLKRELKFNIILCNAYMPDMNVFELLEQLMPEVHVLIIMMSNEEGMDAFMAKGARDCLIKPISNESLKYLWKHTVKKCKNMEQSSNYVDEGNVLLLAQDNNMNNEEVLDMNMDSQSPTSKKRVVWTSDIEIPFLEAVNELGGRACPKAILEHMNKSNPKSNLTRQNIASHLQKHRLRQKNSSGKTENKGAANPSPGVVRQNGDQFGTGTLFANTLRTQQPINNGIHNTLFKTWLMALPSIEPSFDGHYLPSFSNSTYASDAVPSDMLQNTPPPSMEALGSLTHTDSVVVDTNNLDQLMEDSMEEALGSLTHTDSVVVDTNNFVQLLEESMEALGSGSLTHTDFVVVDTNNFDQSLEEFQRSESTMEGVEDAVFMSNVVNNYASSSTNVEDIHLREKLEALLGYNDEDSHLDGLFSPTPLY